MRGIEIPDLPPTCIITYCAGLLERAAQRHSHTSFDIGITVPTNIHVFRPTGGSPYAIVAGRPGAPIAAVLLEELIELGFRQFLVFGTAGHPANGKGAPPFGQLVLPDRAYVYEGTSVHYGWKEPAVPMSPVLRNRLAIALRDAGVGYLEASAATMDALYRETTEWIAELIDLGVGAIDMELSALLSVARFRGAELAAVLCISDVIHQEGSWTVGMASDDLRDSEERMLPVLEKAAAGYLT
jgi:uridine phosphorylase